MTYSGDADIALYDSQQKMLKHIHINLRKGVAEAKLQSTLHVHYHHQTSFNPVILNVNFLNVSKDST